MAWKFSNPWGGALGRLGSGIEEVQAAMDGLQAGYSIKLTRKADNSWVIAYFGKEAERWTGRIVNPDGSEVTGGILPVDVTSPANILGEYVCYNPDTGSSEWANAPNMDEGWENYHVADAASVKGSYGNYLLSRRFVGDIIRGGAGAAGFWSGKILSWDGTPILSVDVSDPENLENTHVVYDGYAQAADWSSGAESGKYSWHVADSDGEGGYVLSGDTRGDIIVPVPEEWDERQIIQSDPDGLILWGDATLTADGSGEETGFEFVKPTDTDYGLAQLKPKGTTKGHALLGTGSAAAAWDGPLVKTISNLKLSASGSSLTISLTVTYTDDSEEELTDTISGATCDS